MSKRLYTLLKRMLQKPEIPSGADLNDYLAPGKYRLKALSNYTNVPSGYDTYSAYMKVHRQYNPASNNYTEQRLTLGSNYLTFVRRWNGTAWSTWVTYAGSRDLIVEQGTSGIWTYRKWASGLCEAHGSIASKKYSLNKATGYLYYADAVTQSLPSGIFKTIKQIQPTTQATTGIPLVTITSFTTSNITFRMSYTVSSATSITAVVSFYIIGTWK